MTRESGFPAPDRADEPDRAAESVPLREFYVTRSAAGLPSETMTAMAT